jgi:hypothetical protein
MDDVEMFLRLAAATLAGLQLELGPVETHHFATGVCHQGVWRDTF